MQVRTRGGGTGNLQYLIPKAPVLLLWVLACLAFSDHSPTAAKASAQQGHVTFWREAGVSTYPEDRPTPHKEKEHCLVPTTLQTTRYLSPVVGSQTSVCPTLCICLLFFFLTQTDGCLVLGQCDWTLMTDKIHHTV